MQLLLWSLVLAAVAGSCFLLILEAIRLAPVPETVSNTRDLFATF